MPPVVSACSSILRLLAAIAFLPELAWAAGSDADPLPSWNDGPAKRSIVHFVRRVSDPASPDHVAPAERIAVFENHGTRWPEYPVPCQERGR
jgi:hypothetical protein